MTFQQPVDVFRSNIDSVLKLVTFDKEVQEIAIRSVEQLHEKLKRGGNDNEQTNGKRTLDILRGIRESPVLKQRYELIFNQAVVLLVSHFGSALGDLFRLSAAAAFANKDGRILDVELKLRVHQILELADAAKTSIGDLLISKDDISFQDMQSTHRAFGSYFDVAIETDDVVRNIVVAQACRHVIGHESGRANARLIKQIRNATPRSLKKEMSAGQSIRFSLPEIEQLATSMRTYIERLALQLGALAPSPTEDALGRGE